MGISHGSVICPSLMLPSEVHSLSTCKGCAAFLRPLTLYQICMAWQPAVCGFLGLDSFLPARQAGIDRTTRYNEAASRAQVPLPRDRPPIARPCMCGWLRFCKTANEGRDIQSCKPSAFTAPKPPAKARIDSHTEEQQARWESS